MEEVLQFQKNLGRKGGRGECSLWKSSFGGVLLYQFVLGNSGCVRVDCLNLNRRRC